MSDLERLNIVLAARDREFASAMERNQRRVERFASRSNAGLSKTARSFDMLGFAARRLGPLIAVLGAGAMIGRLRQTVTALDDIGKTADKLGITTDALQELRAVAESEGIGQASLDSSIERFNKRLGEAQLGAGAAAKTLRQLGLEATHLSNVGLDQALSLVADKIKDLPSQTERAAAAAALFGREGVAMVNLLRRGADGMDQMRKEARALGIVIDEDLIRNAETAQTKLDLMSRVIGSQVSQALINLAPLLTSAAEGIAGISRAINGLLDLSFELPALNDAADLREYAAQYSEMSSEVNALSSAQSAYNANIEKFGENSEQAAKWAARVTTAQEKLNAAVETHRQKTEATAAAVAGLEALGTDTKSAQERARLAGMTAEAVERERIDREKMARVDAIVSNAKASGQALSDGQLGEVLALADAWERAQIAANKIINPPENGGGSRGGSSGASRAVQDMERNAEDYAEALAEVDRLFGSNIGLAGEYSAALKAVADDYRAGRISSDEFQDALGDIETGMSNVKSEADGLRSSFAQTFSSIVTGAESASDALSSLLGNLAGQFASAAFGGLFKGSGIFDVVGSLLSFEGGGYTGAGPRAGGLDGKGGTLAMVHPNESIIDHNKGGGGSGGSGGVSINIAVSGARGNSEIVEMVQTGVRQGLREYDRSVLPRSVQKINNDPRRIG